MYERYDLNDQKRKTRFFLLWLFSGKPSMHTKIMAFWMMINILLVVLDIMLYDEANILVLIRTHQNPSSITAIFFFSMLVWDVVMAIPYVWRWLARKNAI